MEIICPIDSQFPDQIAEFLKPPSAQEVEEYFKQLIASRQCRGIKVKIEWRVEIAGVYADMDFEEGDLVLKDQMLVGIQHFPNKIDCFVCGFCFRFLGLIELQIGRKLYLQNLGVTTKHECDKQAASSMGKDGYQSESSDDEVKSDIDYRQYVGECASSSSTKIPLPKEIVESLMNEELVLPYSKAFSQPSVVPCPDGCSEGDYCSKPCMEADREMFHSLLCTGEGSKSRCKEALQTFIRHANETNDIFLLAAKAIVSTILKYRKLKAARQKEQGTYKCSEVSGNCDLPLLLEAWKPISMGYKRRCFYVKLVGLHCFARHVDSCDEAAFRASPTGSLHDSLKTIASDQSIKFDECSSNRHLNG